MKNSKVSFFIPAWNCEQTIAESIDSINNGNIEDGDEIVIVDDASTDNTPRVLEEYSKKNNYIKIIRLSENRGGSVARNTAIENCKNEILFCLDSDNVLVPGSVIKLKKFMLENDADAATFEALHYFKGGKGNITHKWIFRSGIHSFADCLAGSITPIASGNYMFKKESWKRAGGYKEEVRTSDTWVFGLRQLATGTKMVIMPDSFYFHRFGIESNWITHSKKGTDRSLIMYNTLKHFNDLIDDENMKYIEENKEILFFSINYPIKTKKGYGKTGEVKTKKSIKEYIFNLTPSLIKKNVNILLAFLLYILDFKKFLKISNSQRGFLIKWGRRYAQLNDKTKKPVLIVIMFIILLGLLEL